MIAGQCSCSHYLPPCSRSMIGARYHRRLLTLGDTDLDHNSRPAASTSSGSDFVPSIGLASFRPPHQRQRSSHETKAEPPCEQRVGPSVYLQSYPGNGGKYQGGNPCDDGENDEYAGDQWLTLCSMRTCRRGSTWSGSDRPDLHRIGEVSLPDIIRACSGPVIAGSPQLGKPQEGIRLRHFSCSIRVALGILGR